MSHDRYLSEIIVRYVQREKEAMMIDVMDLEDEGTATAPVELWSRAMRSSKWTAGYPELTRAALALTRSSNFLARHWGELEAATRDGLLQSIEATAHDVARLLGYDPYRADTTFDEALAARVATL
jgi:hypothetical protein